VITETNFFEEATFKFGSLFVSQDVTFR